MMYRPTLHLAGIAQAPNDDGFQAKGVTNYYAQREDPVLVQYDFDS